MNGLPRHVLFILAVVFGLNLAAPVPAGEMMKKPKNYPVRPLTMIVPYGAGGGSDQLSRSMAKAVEKVIRVGIQVVNKPGGGGRAAIPDFMAARADGYTVMEHIDDAVTLYASGKIRENPGKDWVPLAIAQVTFSQVYIRPNDRRFSDWNSFLKYAKANPGKVTIANVGNVGSMERVNMLKLEQALGFKTQQISFDKPAERYAALVGGQVDALFEQPGDVRKFLEANRMKPILTFLKERPSAFANVPSLTDVRVNFEALLRFRGFYAHKNVPQDRLEYLEWAFSEGFKSAEFQAFNEKKYMHLINSYRNTAGAKKMIADAVTTYKQVYKEIGLVK
ncbi:MAG: tripartite tricarboxylate transporter substrate binding protein [Acidiferrobacterales bacterium]